jgi:hypothetical protein
MLRFCLHYMRRLMNVEYSGCANTEFPSVCRGFASRVGVLDLIDRRHRCRRRGFLSKISRSQMRNGFKTPERSEKVALGLFLEKEPKQSRK